MTRTISEAREALVVAVMTEPVGWLASKGQQCKQCRTRGPHGERLLARIALRQLGADHAPSGWVCSAACEAEAERVYLRIEREGMRDQTARPA